MTKYNDLVGQRFNKLLVLSLVEITNNGPIWLCRCDCGIEKNIFGTALKQGTIKSCGCSILRKYPPEILSARNIWKKRYSEGDLSFEDFLRLTKLPCHYCGVEPSNCANSAKIDKKASDFAKVNGDYIYNGLDRVDNSKKHNLDNVVPCCKWCNIAKRDRTLQDFENWIIKVTSRIDLIEETPIINLG
jgi:hypothetical protein